MKFRVITDQEFDAFAAKYSRRNFWQTSTMSKFREVNGWKAHYVGVEENNMLIAAVTLTSFPLRFGFKAFEASRGLCVDYENEQLLAYFLKEVEKYCRINKGLYLRFDPYYPLIERDIDGNIVEGGFDHRDLVSRLQSMGYRHFGYTTGNLADFEPRWAFVLDLNNKNEEDILKEMSQKTRNHIFSTQRKGIHVRDLSLNEISLFTDMMNHTAERRSFESRNEAFYYNQYKHLAKFMCVKVAEMHVDEYLRNLDEIKKELVAKIEEVEAVLSENPLHKKSLKLLKATKYDYEINEEGIKKAQSLQREYGEVIPMASSFFVTYGDEIFYLFSAAYDKFLKFNPSVALQWEMISYGIKNKYHRYNFYGITGVFDKDDEGYGVYQFKRGFNGYVEELIGVFEKPISWFYPIYQIIKKIIGR